MKKEETTKHKDGIKKLSSVYFAHKVTFTYTWISTLLITVADPGFPRRERAPSPKMAMGTNLLFGQKCPQKCMKIKGNWMVKGALVHGAPAPSGLANGSVHQMFHFRGQLDSQLSKPLRQGNVFTPVSHSVHGGGGVCLSACWDTHTPWADTPGQTSPGQTPPPPGGHCSILIRFRFSRASQMTSHDSGFHAPVENSFPELCRYL